MDKEKPVSFDLLRINKGMKKICTCNPPHYEISVENRIIMCRDCGAVVDPFEAMLSIARYHEQLREETNRLKRKVRAGCFARWKNRIEKICFRDVRSAKNTLTHWKLLNLEMQNI